MSKVSLRLIRSSRYCDISPTKLYISARLKNLVISSLLGLWSPMELSAIYLQSWNDGIFMISITYMNYWEISHIGKKS